MNQTPVSVKKRIIFAFVIISLMLCGLFVRIGWIQIVQGDEYSKMALELQTKDIPVPAKRGIVYDRNGNELAMSAVTFSIWARPDQVREGSSSSSEPEDNVDEAVDFLAMKLNMEEDDVRSSVTKEQSLVKVAKYIDKEVADEIRAEGIPGIEIAEDVKRYYPLGSFASQILGSVTDDNNGLAGLELEYNKYLSGISGRWIKTTDGAQNSLAYGMEKYYQAEDGLNLVLTIDEVIQHYVEKALDDVMINTGSDEAWGIVMDPKTGDILGMASTPDYDPNDPRTPLDPEEAAYVETLTESEQLDYWNEMWRNPIISDLFEPGSTFKLFTAAMALEEQKATPSSTFVCNGTYTVAGQRLSCWRSHNPHGLQTLTEAVGNSCNPATAEIVGRIGTDTFYEYLGLFGIDSETGIDFPGEAQPIIQNQETAGPVGLTTMAYGQGISVTALQLITSLSSFGNDGKLMEPRLVKALTDSDGNIVEEFEPKVVRQAVSEQTATEMLAIMEHVVLEGTGGAVNIPGYGVGGKSGTAEQTENGIYNDTFASSFYAMAPIDDPQIAVLVVAYNPKGVTYGSQTAAPGVRAILEETLPYLNIEQELTDEEMEELIKRNSVVPDLSGMTFVNAGSEIGRLGLNYIISPEVEEGEIVDNFIVLDQYPKAGTPINMGGTVYLYRE